MTRLKKQNLLEKRKESLSDIEKRLKGFNEELKSATEETQKEELKKRIEKWTAIKEKMAEKIDTKVDELSSKK